eukprot:jgi/Astpho2/1463/Aster-05351
MATSAAHTAALMELNQTMVNLTPTFHQLVVALTPQPEARKKSLSVAPSTATSEKARQIQRRLGYHFDYNNKGPHTGGDHLLDLPMFEWAAFRAEDDAAAQACKYLQVHFAPEKCTVIAVQRVPWLGQEWDFPDVHLHIRRGKTDYLFIWTGQGAEELLQEIQQSQEKQQLISQLNTDISNALSHLESCVGQLTLHAVGFYEAKKPSNLLTGRSKHRIQTELCWIVLNTKQHNAAPEHPGAAAVLGDFNRQDIYRQPDKNVGNLSERLCIEILSSRFTNKGRAAAARRVRQLLQSSVDELEARQDWIFEERPNGASTPQEAQLLANDSTRYMPGPSGVQASERSPSPSSPQTAPMTDRELHCSADIAAALQDHLSKPHVYEALGHTAPPSIPYWCPAAVYFLGTQSGNGGYLKLVTPCTVAWLFFECMLLAQSL